MKKQKRKTVVEAMLEAGYSADEILDWKDYFYEVYDFQNIEKQKGEN